MKAREFRELTLAELATREAEAREQMFKLRFQIAMGQVEGVRKYRATRKDLARILTVAAERRREEAAGQRQGGSDG